MWRRLAAAGGVALPAPLLSLQIARQLAQPVRRRGLQSAGIQEVARDARGVSAALPRAARWRADRRAAGATSRASANQPATAAIDLLECSGIRVPDPARPRARTRRGCAAHRPRRSRRRRNVELQQVSINSLALEVGTCAQQQATEFAARSWPRSRAWRSSMARARRTEPSRQARCASAGGPFVAAPRAARAALKRGGYTASVALLQLQWHRVGQFIDLEAPPLPRDAVAARARRVSSRARCDRACGGAVPPDPRRARSPCRPRSRSTVRRQMRGHRRRIEAQQRVRNAARSLSQVRRCAASAPAPAAGPRETRAAVAAIGIRLRRASLGSDRNSASMRGAASPGIAASTPRA